VYIEIIMKADSILELIGNTPHVRLARLFAENQVWMKLERANPGSSIKDRIALAMITDAEKNNLLTPDSVIVEPTSGNTGIGLAIVCAVKGYRLVLTMPESMSLERRRYLKALGAELVLTPKELGMKGAIAEAEKITAENDNAWMPQQFENEANVQVHRQSTAQEILRDYPDGLDYLITGVGTGGHISGCASILKEAWPRLTVLAVEPSASAVLSGKDAGPHPIQGIGAGFIPRNFYRDNVDDIITVDADEAFEMARNVAQKEGIFVGISSGASLAAVKKVLPKIDAKAGVLTFCYDTGERYLSVDNLFAA